jgi:hypothetical protein
VNSVYSLFEDGRFVNEVAPCRPPLIFAVQELYAYFMEKSKSKPKPAYLDFISALPASRLFVEEPSLRIPTVRYLP